MLKIKQAKLPFYPSVEFLYSPGFTLIELLVSITIMLLLISGGIAAYVKFNDKQVILNEAKDLQSYFRSAQSRARVGDRPSGCTRLEGYSIQVTAGSSTVDLIAVCSSGNINRGQYELENNVTVGSDVNLEFYVLHGGVSSSQTITLNSQSGLQYSFEVTQGGEITGGSLVTQ